MRKKQNVESLTNTVLHLAGNAISVNTQRYTRQWYLEKS